MAIADLSQRQQALDPQRSFAVSAPAGSGKTALLTQRVLKLLALVENPEEILCLTFTRKATGEMLQRISEALQFASTTDTPPTDAYKATTWRLAKAALARNKQQQWQLLKSPNRLRIQTIDGFCRNLAQQLSIESGFTEMSEPLTQPYPHYQQAVAELLLDQLQHNGELTDAIATLLVHLDNDLNKLEKLLIGLLEKREQWLHQLLSAHDARPYLEQCLQETIEETLFNLSEQLQPIGSDLALLADYAASNLIEKDVASPLNICREITELPDCEAEQIACWQGLVHLLITASDSKPDWRSDKGINIKLGFPTGKVDPEFGEIRKTGIKEVLAWCRQQPDLLEALLDVRHLPTAAYSDQQWQVMSALTQLLPRLVAQLKVHFQQQNCCDFTEITLAALQSLGDADNPTDLTLKLDYQIQHILIDEFQDTSSIQFEILRRLTQGWQPDDGRSLFIVGDGMQSLYGFRSANVGLFLEARSQGIGDIPLEPLDLTVNFRSQAGIIDWVNEAFTKSFPKQDNMGRGAVSYNPATAFHPDSDKTPVTIDAFLDYEGSDVYLAEAQRVAELVNEAKQQNSEGSIAILVRNKSHLRDIFKTLYNSGFSWQANDIDPLQGRMPVIDLMSLTRALLSPADRIAWLSILRAPWCGLDLHDLFHLSNASADNDNQQGYPLLLTQILGHQNIEAISNNGHQILDRISTVLNGAWQQRQRKPLRSWVEGVWVALGGPAALRQPEDMAHCQQYFDLLEQQSPIQDWALFQQAVEKLFAAPNPDADPNLHVMTIHKAKGLEFDTVIIPGLNRSGGNDQQQLLLWRERVSESGHHQLLIAPLQGSGEDKDPIYRHLQQEAKEKSRLENTRVLYVGATRAIDKLHLLFNIKTKAKPTNNALLKRLWPWLESELTSAMEAPHPFVSIHRSPHTEDSADGETSAELLRFNTLQRLPVNWAGDGASAQLETAGEAAINKITIQSASPVAMHIGTVLHRILRQITLSGVEHWNEQTIEQHKPFWVIQLQQLGVIDIENAIETLQQAVTKTLTDKTGQWLLNHQHEDSQCEYALGYIDNNQQPRTAIIDRTFVADGERWIVDYKSGQPEVDETIEQFLARQQTNHRGQLEQYAKLIKQLPDQQQNPSPVKIALYFPLLSHLEVLA